MEKINRIKYERWLCLLKCERNGHFKLIDVKTVYEFMNMETII